MSYYTVKHDTTVETMKRARKNDDQHIFPYIDEHNIYQGLIYGEDLDEFEDSTSASHILDAAKGDRDIYVYATQPSTEAKAILRRRNLQFIPVVDRYHRIVGTFDDAGLSH